MNLDDYQTQAGKTAIYDDADAVVYPLLGLCSEIGELHGKYKKLLRDSNGLSTPQFREEMAAELGDVLWYLAVLSQDLGQSLDRTAEMNLEKLSERKKRGTLVGSGDNR